MSSTDTEKPVILLVDDDEVIRTMGRDILRILGYEALLAEHGDETIKLYREYHQRISLVLLDWHMPGMSGPEILEHLWQINSNVKVILATGWGPPREMEEIRRKGYNVGLLQKPYLVKDLQNEIAKHLSSE
jgi:two-component system, cell cycle sensor histidine kinase and response regulator CckA